MNGIDQLHAVRRKRPLDFNRMIERHERIHEKTVRQKKAPAQWPGLEISRLVPSSIRLRRRRGLGKETVAHFLSDDRVHPLNFEF